MRISVWSSDVCSSDLDVTLEAFREIVALLDGPVARDRQVQVDEPLAAGFAGPGRADLHELAFAIAVEPSLDRGEVIAGPGGVEQPGERPLPAPVAGAPAVDTSAERDERRPTQTQGREGK